MARAASFHSALQNSFLASAQSGADYVDVNAGWLHRQVGGYPGRNHRMPVCCAAMRSEMQPGDKILSAPPKGNGASLVVRYILPRPARPQTAT